MLLYFFVEQVALAATTTKFYLGPVTAEGNPDLTLSPLRCPSSVSKAAVCNTINIDMQHF